MLTAIHIRHFALIEQLSLELSSGMTVITGETGAGKSIIIDAIQFALGNRSQIDYVRAGEKQTDITLVFDIKSCEAPDAFLKEHALDGQEECIIRRTLTSEGRHRVTVNNIPCTVALLKQLGELLMSIQGQHEQQHLLKPDAALQMIDHYGSLHSVVKTVETRYLAWKTACNERDHLLQQDQNQEAAFLQFQLAELQDAKLCADEWETIVAEHKQLSQVDVLAEQVHKAITHLSHTSHGIVTQLHTITHLLDSAPMLTNAHQLCKQACLCAEEAVLELQHYTHRLHADPERLKNVDERLSLLQKLARKHRVKPDELLTLQQTLETRLTACTHREDRLQQLQKEIDAAHTHYQTQAALLSQQRKKTATKLAKKITEKIQLLHMKGGFLEFEFGSLTEPSAKGLDKIQLLVSTNPGHSAKPLAKIASGGELSRVSLAIQVICAEKEMLPALIFDEVDAGIGGATAEKVGQLLRDLSQYSQVLCITHLSSIAAFARHHFHVEKRVEKHMTSAYITLLSHEDRIKELARMTGRVTQETLTHAKNLLTEVETG